MNDADSLAFRLLQALHHFQGRPSLVSHQEAGQILTEDLAELIAKKCRRLPDHELQDLRANLAVRLMTATFLGQSPGEALAFVLQSIKNAEVDLWRTRQEHPLVYDPEKAESMLPQQQAGDGILSARNTLRRIDLLVKRLLLASPARRRDRVWQFLSFRLGGGLEQRESIKRVTHEQALAAGRAYTARYVGQKYADEAFQALAPTLSEDDRSILEKIIHGASFPTEPHDAGGNDDG